MTEEDIIRMEREAGFHILQGGLNQRKLFVMNPDHMMKFAALVAAFEREECAQVVEQAGIDGYGTLAAALLIRERGAP